MKLLLALLGCAALGSALVQTRLSSGSSVPNHRWLDEVVPEYNIEVPSFRPGSEYKFVYNGQLLTGIPSSSKQHSGTRIQALVTLVFKSHESVLLKILEVRMGKLNRFIPNPRVILPFMVFQHEPIVPELRETLELPLKFSYRQGLISDIVFDGSEKPWSANIKRGILNLLQVNLSRRNVVDSTEALTFNEPIQTPIDPKFDFFRVVEPTLEGECETAYTVLSEPHPYYTHGPVLNVTKTINFEKCTKRPQIKYNFRFQDPCPSSKFSEDEKFLKSSSVFKFNITGTPESFLIESAKVESQYVAVPFNEEGNVVVTYVNQTLVLVRAGPVSVSVPEPRNPKPSDSQMVFSPDWDILKEKFFMEGEELFHRETPFPGLENPEELVSSVLRKLVRAVHEKVEDEAPRHFDSLVKVFRILKINQIRKVWRMFYVEIPSVFTPEEHKKIKHFIVDAVATAGTKDNLEFLVEQIKSRQIPPYLAAIAIKSLINVRVVSKEMIHKLWELKDSEVVKRNFFLKQSVYLTFGSMIHALATPNKDVLALDFKLTNPESYLFPRNLRTKIVTELFEEFKRVSSWEDKILILKTISNSGLDLAVFELEKIIKNVPVRYPVFIRSEAVLALRQIKDFMPRKVQKILMPVFMSRYEPPELRIVAAYQIFQTLPERPILDQISQRMITEKSRQVLSFVFSYMHTMANSTNPCEKEFVRNLKLSLRHVRYPSFAFLMGYSKYLHKSLFSEKYNLGLDMEYGTVFSNSSFLPTHGVLNVNPLFAGFWAKHFLTFGFSSQGFEKIFWKYFGERGFFFEKPMEELLSSVRSPRSRSTINPSSELKSMFESLRIRPREYFPNKPSSMFFMRFKDQEFGFLPFSFDSIPQEYVSMFESGRFSLRSVERFLSSGFQMSFYKAFFLHEVSYKIPTTLGLPLQIRTVVPTVASLHGMIKIQLPETSQGKITLILNDFKPSFVSVISSNVQVWSPVVNSGLRVLAKASFFYPITGKVEVDLNERSSEAITLEIEPPTRPVHLFSLETRPLTWTRVWPSKISSWNQIIPEEKTIVGEEWTRVQKFDKSFGEEILGLKLRFRGFWHETPMKKLVDTPISPLSGPNKFVVYTEPGYLMPKKYVVKLGGDLFLPMSESLRPEFSEFEDFEESYEPFKPSEWRKFSPISGGSHHKITLEVLTHGSSTPRRFFLDSVLKFSNDLKYIKLFSKFERTPIPRFETTPFKLTFDLETLFPETPMSFSELVGKKAVGHLKVKWGPTLSEFIKMSVVGERSKSQVSFEKTSPEYRLFSSPLSDKTLSSPLFQSEHLYEFAHLLLYKYKIDYSHVPVWFQNTTNDFFRFFKHYYFWQTDVAQISVRNPVNKIRAFLTIDPFTKQYFNVTIKTPVENTTFHDIPMNSVPVPLPLFFSSFFPMRPSWFPMLKNLEVPLKTFVSPFNLHHSRPSVSFLDSVAPMTPFTPYPTCTVSTRYISTFDKVKYTVPLSTCWTVLSKDCSSSEEVRFGVYMKKLTPESELKKVKIVSRYHRFVLVPETESPESVMVEFNGRKIRPEEFEPVLDHGHTVAQVTRVGKFLVFTLPETGVKVFFDGYTVIVKMSPMYSSIHCGLCGHYDGEPSDEFRLPSHRLTESVPEFYRSYILPESSCQIPELSTFTSFEPVSYLESSEIFSRDGDMSESLESSEMVPADTPFVHTNSKFCPVCHTFVREARRIPRISLEQLRPLVIRKCREFSSVSTVECERFFTPSSVEDLLDLIKDDDMTPEDVCSDYTVCSSFTSNPRNPLHFNSPSYSRFPSSSEEWFRSPSKSSSPVLSTKVIEQMDKLCFSKEPVPVCPHHTFVHTHKPTTKRVVFACIPRSEPRAETWYHRISSSSFPVVIREISSLQSTFTETLYIPEVCKPF